MSVQQYMLRYVGETLSHERNAYGGQISCRVSCQDIDTREKDVIGKGSSRSVVRRVETQASGDAQARLNGIGDGGDFGMQGSSNFEDIRTECHMCNSSLIIIAPI